TDQRTMRPVRRCLLLRSILGVKRTCLVAPHMSAFDPKRTSPLNKSASDWHEHKQSVELALSVNGDVHASLLDCRTHNYRCSQIRGVQDQSWANDGQAWRTLSNEGRKPQNARRWSLESRACCGD